MVEWRIWPRALCGVAGGFPCRVRRVDDASGPFLFVTFSLSFAKFVVDTIIVLYTALATRLEYGIGGDRNRQTGTSPGICSRSSARIARRRSKCRLKITSHTQTQVHPGHPIQLTARPAASQLPSMYSNSSITASQASSPLASPSSFAATKPKTQLHDLSLPPHSPPPFFSRRTYS